MLPNGYESEGWIMLHQLLRPNRKEAPRKKLRGLRRYFRRVLRLAESHPFAVSESDWYDLWHHHADWYGYGNVSWRMRARHLEALAKAFSRFAQQLNQFDKPYQLFIYLNGKDSSQDAVYVHTANPNHDNFPVMLDDAEWDIPLVLQYFEAMLPGFRLRAGVLRLGDGDHYYVYGPDIGLSLERR